MRKSKVASIAVSMFAIAALGWSMAATAQTVAISDTVNGSPLTVSITPERFAGAIDSIVYRGVQYIDIVDHGRQMQTAIGVDNLGECYNPNEAGSRADANKYTTSSVLTAVSTANNVLSTSTQAAFWLNPYENYNGPCGLTSVTTAQNTTVLSNFIISRSTSFYGPAIPNLLQINTSIYVPESRSSASVEALTAYLPPSFSEFLSYDRASRTLARLTADATIKTQQVPVIIAQPNGNHAMGVTSNDITVPGSGRSGYFAYIKYGGSTPTSKWSCVYNEIQIVAGTTFNYSCPVAVGSVDEVVAAIDAYPGAAVTSLVPVFRFYKYPQHFITRSYTEGAAAGLTFEMTAFHVYPAGGSGMHPLYRCYNAANRDHFISTQASCEGKNYEGNIGFASDEQGQDMVPLYRFYRANTKDHLTTVNYAEGSNNGYAYEGVLGYVFY